MSKTTVSLLAITMLIISIFSFVSIADKAITKEGVFLLFFSDFFGVTYIVSAIFDLLKKNKKG